MNALTMHMKVSYRTLSIGRFPLFAIALILMSLMMISQIIQSYISPLRCCMLIFKTLTQLKLRILTSLVIGSLIITMIGVGIRVYTYSLMRGFIGRIYDYSLYYRATYYRQQLCPPYNRPSIIFIMLQLVTTGRSKWALVPPYCGLILIERQELANHILLQFCLPRFVI